MTKKDQRQIDMFAGLNAAGDKAAAVRVIVNGRDESERMPLTRAELQRQRTQRGAAKAEG